LGDKIEYSPDRYTALENADALLIVTEWPVFRTPDFDFMKEKLKAPVIFDGRNLYDLDRMKDHGFYYNSIGRKTVG
ncbi:MAG: UDP-glucose/GDP-mannose dehydrogenase family protein, partial [Mucilaginibacter sp.]